MRQYHITVNTSGKSFNEITHIVTDFVAKAGVSTGICSLYMQHTSASLVLCENADEDVKKDLENFFQKLVPEDIHQYHHKAEGKDDMPAHIRTVLTKCDLTLPIVKGELGLGTWQGIYIWEHRNSAFERRVVVTIIGE
ncbi:MAG: YjbQ family protein [Gammaproteobacteria bacterium]|nr:YjbQ family protein [Gammaproteobacteria bacterium]